LRLDATVWQISAIHVEQRDLIFDYTNRSRVEQLAKLQMGRLRIVDDEHVYVRLKHDQPTTEMWLRAAKSVLRPQ
jgi:transcription-repair coupling factor (superfamily II helicase)